MLYHLQSAHFLRMDIKRGHYKIMCIKDQKLLIIQWSLTIQREIDISDGYEVYDRVGSKIASSKIQLGGSPYYFYDLKAEVA